MNHFYFCNLFSQLMHIMALVKIWRYEAFQMSFIIVLFVSLLSHQLYWNWACLFFNTLTCQFWFSMNIYRYVFIILSRKQTKCGCTDWYVFLLHNVVHMRNMSFFTLDILVSIVFWPNFVFDWIKFKLINNLSKILKIVSCRMGGCLMCKLFSVW